MMHLWDYHKMYTSVLPGSFDLCDKWILYIITYLWEKIYFYFENKIWNYYIKSSKFHCFVKSVLIFCIEKLLKCPSTHVFVFLSINIFWKKAFYYLHTWNWNFNVTFKNTFSLNKTFGTWFSGPTSGGVVLRSKLVDERC